MHVCSLKEVCSVHYFLYKHLIIQLKYYILLGYYDMFSGKLLDTFKFFVPRKASHHRLCIKYILKGGTDCHKGLRSMLDGMADKQSFSYPIHEALKRLNSAIVFHSSHINR